MKKDTTVRDLIAKLAQYDPAEVDEQYRDVIQMAKEDVQEGSEPVPDAIQEFNPEEHILLCDLAHKRRIDTETDEYAEYLERVRNHPDDLKIFQVQIPEWPPVYRSPLALLMSLNDDGTPAGPFAKRPWTGVQYAIENQMWARNTAFGIAKRMSPFDEDFSPEHLAYQWQCPAFDPARHVIIRYWCRDNAVDIVDFLRDFMKQNPDFEIFEVANPTAGEEQKQTGQWSPTRRVFPIEKLPFVENHFGLKDSILPEGSVRPAPMPTPKPKIIPDDLSVPDQDQKIEKVGITQDLTVYSPSEVTAALQKALGRDFRLFGGQTSDSKIVALTEAAAYEFLQSDDTDRGTYVLDEGARNYDCDNFADTLRNALQRRYGINCIGIIWGDRHAWNFFIVSSSDGPKVMFVEPQDDRVVEALEGAYSIGKRCEIYL